MTAGTRLGQPAVGLAAYGAFNPKTAAPTTGPHNPGVITRLCQMGVGWATYGTFLPKAAASDETASKTWITRGPSFGRFSRHKGYSR